MSSSKPHPTRPQLSQDATPASPREPGQRCAEPWPRVERTDFVPLPPVHPENGTQIVAELAGAAPQGSLLMNAEIAHCQALSTGGSAAAAGASETRSTAISYHRAGPPGTEIDPRDPASQQTPGEPPEDGDLPMQSMIRRALALPKRGRPTAFDEHAKGKLVALLALGLSVRQSAGVLGVSHPTILRALAADHTLSEEINSARFQAQLQPLGCVIREAQRSWRAASWLLMYLDGKLTSHEETPAEKLEREDREKHAANLRWEERRDASLARDRARREAERKEEVQKQLAELHGECRPRPDRRKRKPKPGA